MFLHLAQYQPKKQDTLCESNKQSYYADKGVVFSNPGNVVNKETCFFQRRPPTRVIVEVERAKMQFGSFTEWPQ